MKKNVTVGRLLVLFLAIAMLSAGLFAGCTKEADETEPTQPITTEEKQTEATAEAEEQEPDMASMEETLDIIWWGYNVPGYLPTNNSYMKSFLEDKYNITIEDLMVDLGNKEQVNIMLATGVDFDVRTQNQDFASIHELGLVRSIPEEYIINYAPALYEPLFEEAGEDWKLYATIDGEIFGVPALSYTFLAPVVMGLRTDWIEAVGYDPENLPTTLEGLEELLTKFRTDDPDGNGVQDTYALSKFDDYDPYVFGAYGISDRYWYNDEAGNPVYYATDEKYKEVLKVLQRWYAEGIFDPEVVTDGRTEVQVKFVADKLAGYYGNEWAFTEGHNLSPLKKAKDEGKEIGVTIVPPVSLDAGSEAATLHYSLGLNTNGMVFGVNCTDEKLVRILQIENDMFTDMELLRLSFFGQEGYSYTLNEDGTVNTTDAYNSEYVTNFGLQRYLFYGFLPRNILPYRMQKDRLDRFNAVFDFNKIEPNTFSNHKTEADLEYSSALSDIAEEFYWKAVTGEIDIDAEWDGYVGNWLKAGGQEVLDQKQVLYDSMK